MYSVTVYKNTSLLTAEVTKGRESLGGIVAAILAQRYTVSGVASYHVVGKAGLAKKVYKALRNAAPAIRGRLTLTCVYPNKLVAWLYRNGISQKEFDSGIR